jgi:hypothetical protein
MRDIATPDIRELYSIFVPDMQYKEKSSGLMLRLISRKRRNKEGLSTFSLTNISRYGNYLCAH